MIVKPSFLDANSLAWFDSDGVVLNSELSFNIIGNLDVSGVSTLEGGTVMNTSSTVNGTFTVNTGATTINTATTINANTGIDGDLIVTGDITAFGALSDASIKENLSLINNALDKMTSINGYHFNYKSNPDMQVSGVIAQELLTVAPELVYETYDQRGKKVLAVRYNLLAAYFIESIKELKTRIEGLENND